MQYKTIILQFLEQRPELCQRLRQERKLLTTLEMYAKELKASHQALMEQFRQARPESETGQISSEAFEMAMKEMEDRLPPASTMDDQEALSLDEAMAFVTSPSRRG